MHHKDLKYREQKEQIGFLKYLNTDRKMFPASLRASFSTASLMLLGSFCCYGSGNSRVNRPQRKTKLC